MATPPVMYSSTDHQNLMATLADPEPVCLLAVQLMEAPGPIGTAASIAEPIFEELRRRLLENLRGTDKVFSLPDNRHIIVLPMRVDRRIAEARANRIHDVAKLPYVIEGKRVAYRAAVGAALRLQHESPADLLQRLDVALATSASAGSVAAVVDPASDEPA